MGKGLLEEIKANAQKTNSLAQGLGKGLGAEEQIDSILKHTQQMMRELHNYRKYTAQQQ